MASRLSKFRLPTAAAAMAAQMSKALGSFVLQVVAARELGADGFGIFAFMLGSIVMATALTTGLVGDSLTVLDRHAHVVRRALALVSAAVLAGATLVAFGVAATIGSLSWHVSLAFGAALGLLALEDLGRRVLMAELLFWRLILVDAAGFIATITTLLVALTTWGVSLDAFLVALSVGSLSGLLVAWLCLPHESRRARTPAGPTQAGDLAGEVRKVLAFGLWRAAQQFVRPTMLTLGRLVVLAVASQAALGRLEAARVFVAPAMLLVQGVGYYLFASYARGKELSVEVLLSRADRASSRLLVGALVIGAATAAMVPAFGDVLTAGKFELSVVAVLGWSAYAASVAAVMPYGSLATVRGQQAPFLLFRTLDSLASVGIAYAGVTLLSLSINWVPMLLSVGSFAGGIFCRQFLLKPMVQIEARGKTGPSE